VSPPVHENQLSKSNKLDAEAIWLYKIENFRTLSAPSEIASLREAISSSAAFEQTRAEVWTHAGFGLDQKLKIVETDPVPSSIPSLIVSTSKKTKMENIAM
jgi:hypothetical protein